MRFVNKSNKVIGIGTNYILPDQFVELTDEEAKMPSIKRYTEMGLGTLEEGEAEILARARAKEAEAAAKAKAEEEAAKAKAEAEKANAEAEAATASAAEEAANDDADVKEAPVTKGRGGRKPKTAAQ